MAFVSQSVRQEAMLCVCCIGSDGTLSFDSVKKVSITNNFIFLFSKDEKYFEK